MRLRHGSSCFSTRSTIYKAVDRLWAPTLIVNPFGSASVDNQVILGARGLVVENGRLRQELLE